MMPVMDGWDFRAEQRRTPAIEAIPVAVLSACGLSKRVVLTQLGDVEYFEKPPAMARIVDFVERKCGGGPRS
jgi:DNA-binding response OmpR family regulator